MRTESAKEALEVDADEESDDSVDEEDEGWPTRMVPKKREDEETSRPIKIEEIPDAFTEMGTDIYSDHTYEPQTIRQPQVIQPRERSTTHSTHYPKKHDLENNPVQGPKVNLLAMEREVKMLQSKLLHCLQSHRAADIEYHKAKS